MSSLIENLVSVRDQLDRIIYQIQGPVQSPLPIGAHVYPGASGVDTAKIREEIERIQSGSLRAVSFPPQTIYQCDPVDRPQFMLIGRSGMWPKVRKEYLDKFPTCAACGHNEQLEVHHVEPYHINPAKELDESNLITLCDAPTRPCHRCFGHFWDWKKYNPAVRLHCDQYLTALEG